VLRFHRAKHIAVNPNVPTRLDLKKDRGLTIEWPDGTTSYYSIAYLRRMSPSAEMRELRKEMDRNPLTVLPRVPSSGPLTALDAELVGNYAIRIRFSDGHSTGIYSWDYLYELGETQEERWQQYLDKLKAAGASRE